MSKIFEEFKKNFYSNKFHTKYYRGIKDKKIKKFDKEFYDTFKGKYFNGLPVYYYLKEMNMGRCYDTSAILARAMGDNTSVCRGSLGTMEKIDGADFGHGWVELDGKVYDTTWQIICDKEVYYDLFSITDASVVPSEQFFEDCKELSDWTIRDKEYYENNYIPMIKTNIMQCYEHAELMLRKAKSDEDKMYYEGLIADLPDISKMPEQKLDLSEADFAKLSGSEQDDGSSMQ